MNYRFKPTESFWESFYDWHTRYLQGLSWDGGESAPGKCQIRKCRRRPSAFNPDISCSAGNAGSPERRLAVGFLAAMPVKAD